jgi:hypothetical protein
VILKTDGPLPISLIYEMNIHKEYTEWAVARGVKPNGIAAHRIPGRGLGIIAEKKLEVCRTNLYAALIHVLFMS